MFDDLLKRLCVLGGPVSVLLLIAALVPAGGHMGFVDSFLLAVWGAVVGGVSAAAGAVARRSEEGSKALTVGLIAACAGLLGNSILLLAMISG